jgi:hypothetical protein
MKTLFSIASVLVLSAGPAWAGDGQVSDHSLATMGLSGLRSLSDAQGMNILMRAFSLTAAPARAGDGQVPSRRLSRMGLGAMKVVSDQEALPVRGLSIAIATSHTSGGLTILSIHSPASIGKHFAFSAKVSVSGNTITGGFATASAH